MCYDVGLLWFSVLEMKSVKIFVYKYYVVFYVLMVNCVECREVWVIVIIREEKFYVYYFS